MPNKPTTFSFENSIPPSSWQAHNGGSLHLSARHRRDGEQSLAWTWENCSALDCREMPFALRGRMPGGRYDPEGAGWYAMCAAFGFLAMASEKHRQSVGAIFSRLWAPSLPAHDTALRLNLFNHFPCKETVGRRLLLDEFAERAPAPVEPSPSFKVKPWAGLALARGANFLAAIKGYGQYVWNFECHPKSWSPNEENVYARFVSNGHLQILADVGADSPTTLGYNLAEGWDWARWPGATNKRLTLEEIYSPTETWQTRWLSDETFVGGAAIGGDNGVFAVKLHDTCHDPSFRAVKSYFVFGNAIVCLGSGIDCADPEHSIETTLFQAYLPTLERPVQVNGEVVTELPFEQRFNGDKPCTLLDPYGNGYVLTAGQHANLARQHQQSRTHNNQGPTEGAYAVAWIDHGSAPRDAGYEYAVLPQTTSERLRQFVEQPPYRVLQRDATAHMVEHPERGTIAAAVFAVETELAQGPVIRTDTPVTFAAQTVGDRMQLAVAVPDVGLPRRQNFGFLTGEDVHVRTRPVTVTLLLRGRWATADESGSAHAAKYCDTMTALTITCQNGIESTVTLISIVKREA